jgi:hypothetical protein
MSKKDLNDIQRSLNAIRGELDRADWATRLQALELMMATSQSVIATARKLTEPKQKTVKRTVPVPKVQTVNRSQSNMTTAQPNTKPSSDLTPQKPVPPVG